MVEYRRGRDGGIQGRKGWWNTKEEGMKEYRGGGMVEYMGERDGGIQRSKGWGIQGRKCWRSIGEEGMGINE